MPAPRRPRPEPSKVFVGRARERALLTHLLADAAQGHPGIVVVSGVPGSGKTSLVRWLVGTIDPQDTLVLRTSCSAAAPPLATLGRLVQPVAELAQLVRSHRDAKAPLDLQRDEPPANDLAFAVADELVSRARWRLVVMLVDDIDALDQASADVLDHVLTTIDDAAAGGDVRFLAVLTTIDASEGAGLADRVLRLDSGRAVSVGRFDEHDLFDLLSVSGMRADPSLVNQLLEDTGGLPLLAATAIDVLPDHASAGLRMRTLADAVSVRLASVDADVRSLLQSAAVFGDPWQLGELALVEHRPVAEVDAMVAAAVAHGLVLREGAHLRFAHPVVRNALLEQLSGAARQQRHRQIASTLRETETAADDEAWLRIADHLVRAAPPDGRPGSPGEDEGERRERADVAGRAGSLAMRWNAWNLAARLLSSAADASAGLVPDDELARRHLEAGRAAHFDHDADAAEREYLLAIDHAIAAGETLIRLDAAVHLARLRLVDRPVAPGQAVDVREVEAALVGIDDDLAAVVEAKALLVDALFVANRSEQALGLIEQLRHQADHRGLRGPVDGPLARLNVADGLHRLALLDLDAAEECFDRAGTHAASAEHPIVVAGARSRAAYVRLLKGDLGAAADALSATLHDATEARLWGEAAFAAAQLALLRVLAGHADAPALLEQASRWFRRSGYAWSALVADPAGAADSARRRGTDEGPVEPNGRPSSAPVVHSSVVRALRAVEANDRDGARKMVVEGRWSAGFRGPLTLNNARVAVALIEVGDLLDDPRLVAEPVDALTHRYERGLLVAPGWPALVPRLLATAARHDGRVDDAHRLLRHARGLAERHGLTAELHRIQLEEAVTLAAAAPGDADAELAARELFTLAVAGFDRLGFHGWTARAEAAAATGGVALEASAAVITRERTIFTNDIVGSTLVNARLGDALYLEQLRTHDRLVRARLRAHHGAEIKHTGDGINASFDDPVAAVRCALAIQEDFARWGHDEPDLALSVRCGIARGRLIPSEGDFFGLVQSEAARLCAMAEPGAVVVAGAVAGALDRADAEDLVRRSLGVHHLRGLPEPTDVYRVERAPR